MNATLTIALAIIAFAAAFHLHWAFGGQIGYSVSLPQREDGKPVMSHRIGWWRPAALAVAVALLAVAGLAMSVVGWLNLPLSRDVQRIILAGIGAACWVRVLLPNRYVGAFKRVRSTRWARYDTRLFSPLFLLLGASLIVVAIG